MDVVHLIDERTDGDCNVRTMCGEMSIAVPHATHDRDRVTCTTCADEKQARIELVRLRVRYALSHSWRKVFRRGHTLD